MRKIFLFALGCLATMSAMAGEISVNTLNPLQKSQLVPMNEASFKTYYTRSQYIIPAADLSAISGQDITAVRYYCVDNLGSDWTNDAKVQIYLTEVSGTTLDDFVPRASAKVVYEGTITFPKDELNSVQLLITFDTPYRYNGGNLLVGCDNIEKGTTTPWGAEFRGVEAPLGSSIYGYNASLIDGYPNQQSFLPEATFTYSCPKATALKRYDNPKATSFQLIWTAGSTEDSEWNVYYRVKDSGAAFSSTVVTSNPCTVSGLDPETTYEVKVSTRCSATAESDVSNTLEVTTTELVCNKPYNLQVSNITSTSATFTWSGYDTHIKWIVGGMQADGLAPWDDEEVNAKTYTKTGLLPNTEYYVAVQGVCTATISSDFTTAVLFKTTAATGIDDVNAKHAATKMLQDGQLFILRDGKTYNVLGAEVK